MDQNLRIHSTYLKKWIENLSAPFHKGWKKEEEEERNSIILSTLLSYKFLTKHFTLTTYGPVQMLLGTILCSYSLFSFILCRLFLYVFIYFHRNCLWRVPKIFIQQQRHAPHVLITPILHITHDQHFVQYHTIEKMWKTLTKKT